MAEIEPGKDQAGMPPAKKAVYQSPAIVCEGTITTRAGSPIGSTTEGKGKKGKKQEESGAGSVPQDVDEVLGDFYDEEEAKAEARGDKYDVPDSFDPIRDETGKLIKPKEPKKARKPEEKGKRRSGKPKGKKT